MNDCLGREETEDDCLGSCYMSSGARHDYMGCSHHFGDHACQHGESWILATDIRPIRYVGWFSWWTNWWNNW